MSGSAIRRDARSPIGESPIRDTPSRSCEIKPVSKGESGVPRIEMRSVEGDSDNESEMEDHKSE